MAGEGQQGKSVQVERCKASKLCIPEQEHGCMVGIEQGAIGLHIPMDVNLRLQAMDGRDKRHD
jgi:hypothetical protein